MRQRRRNRLAHDGEDDDPMSVVSNLFDVAMVFALSLIHILYMNIRRACAAWCSTPSTRNMSLLP